MNAKINYAIHFAKGHLVLS